MKYSTPIFKMILLISLIGISLTIVLLLSNATWFPNLIQIVANNFDTQRFHQPTDEQYLQLIQNPNFCTKNEDCTLVCRPTELSTDCNSLSKNIYYEMDITCRQVECRQKLFTYSACVKNHCMIKGF
jgi:hypothetical protein